MAPFYFDKNWGQIFDFLFLGEVKLGQYAETESPNTLRASNYTKLISEFLFNKLILKLSCLFVVPGNYFL